MPKSREKINGLKLKRRRKVVKIILKNTISITLLRRKEGEKREKRVESVKSLHWRTTFLFM